MARGLTAGLSPARMVALLALALVVALGVWFAVRHSGGGSAAPQAPATAISRTGLTTLAKALGRPIYWKGPQAKVTYELTQTADDRTYLRYLPAGAAVGTTTPYLTIGTYAIANAFAVTQAAGRRSGSVKLPVAGGATAFYSRESPTSVYVAFPGSSYQIEVFDPSAARARQIARSGLVVAVPGAASNAGDVAHAAIAATPASLRALAASLGRPIYWAGKASVTYEVTRTAADRVYIRYLPVGVPIGAEKAYLTVGTYKMANAFAVTRAAASQAGSVRIPVTGGGVAFYSRAKPTNVYFATPGAAEQVEVYDPSALRARQLVAFNKIDVVR